MLQLYNFIILALRIEKESTLNFFFDFWRSIMFAFSLSKLNIFLGFFKKLVVGWIDDV